MLLKIRLREMVERRRSRASISIQSSDENHAILWFHLGGLMLMPHNVYDLASLQSGRWDDDAVLSQLTPIGLHIATRLRRLGHEVVRVNFRKRYFVLEVTSEDAWDELLPAVVTIIRNNHPLGDIPVRVRPHNDPRYPDWQQTLVQALYHEYHAQPPSNFLVNSIVRVFNAYASRRWLSARDVLEKLNWVAFVFCSGSVYSAIHTLDQNDWLMNRPGTDGTQYKRYI
jgi:hypothetical protein